MNLPEEVIQYILSFLSPCEILRMRQVSKKFRDITYGHALWKEIYANARLLLPPGPLSSHSTRYLERTLVQSELLSKTWTSQPIKVLRHTEISWRRPKIGGVCMVAFGRWCIFLEEKIIQCHDFDTNTRHSLYDGTAHPMFWFSAFTTTYNNHCWVYLLLVGQRLNDLIRLLGFRVNGDSLSEPDIVDWAHIGSDLFDTWQSTDDFHGSAPFITVRHHKPCVVLDLRTRCLYRLPAPKTQGDLTNESQIFPTLAQSSNLSTDIVLTQTHVIAVRIYTSRLSSDTVPVLIQAFVSPDPVMLHDRNEVRELRLTHEVITRTFAHSFSLLRNSIVDPVTGSVNIRLLNITTTIQLAGKQNHILCLDLTLPKPLSTTDVLPISIRSQRLLESKWSYERHTVSDDGYLRGLLSTESRPPHSGVISARKFAIDATGEECTIVVSDPSPIDLPRDSDDVAFDGMRGRIHCYQLAKDVNQLIAVDLA